MVAKLKQWLNEEIVDAQTAAREWDDDNEFANAQFNWGRADALESVLIWLDDEGVKHGC